MQPTDYFLKLANAGSAVSRYESEQGNAYLASSVEAIKAVFRQGAQFACPSHPYRHLDPLLQPLGRQWLGMGSSAAHDDALLDDVHAFFESHRIFPGIDTFHVTANLPAADFHLALKAMCFALGCRLLFGLDIGGKSVDLARASGAIEEIRSGDGSGSSSSGSEASDVRARTAQAEFSWLAGEVQRQCCLAPTGENAHAVQETILSAAVPLAYGLIWTLSLLGRDEAAQTAIRREATGMNCGASVTRDVLRASPAVAVVKEALRLYPPVWALSRTSTAEQCLADIRIQAGDAVVVSPYALHRMRSAWDSPQQFDPQRFDTGTLKPHTYLPFGAGPRTCPAAKSNVHVLVLAVHAVLRRYSLSISKMPSAHPLVALRPAPKGSVSLRKLAEPR